MTNIGNMYGPDFTFLEVDLDPGLGMGLDQRGQRPQMRGVTADDGNSIGNAVAKENLGE